MLRKRLIVGCSLAGVALVAFCVPGTAGAVLFIALGLWLMLTALSEFFQLAQATKHDADGFVRLTSAFAVLLLLGAVWGSVTVPGHHDASDALEVLILIAFASAGFVQVFRMTDWRAGLARFAVSAAGLFYVGWTLTCLAKLYFSHGMGMGGRYLALYVIAVTKLGDVGAYSLGKYTASRPPGNHKIMPRISPKKSWEGLVGNVAACVVVSALLWSVLRQVAGFADMPSFGMGAAVLFGVVAALLGFLGDAAESVLKRVAGKKDSGNLPGLGGALDVLDSLILVGPAFYAFTLLLANLP